MESAAANWVRNCFSAGLDEPSASQTLRAKSNAWRRSSGEESAAASREAAVCLKITR